MSRRSTVIQQHLQVDTSAEVIENASRAAKLTRDGAKQTRGYAKWVGANLERELEIPASQIP